MTTQWLFIFWLFSSALLAYITWQISPFAIYPRLNIAVIILFFITVFASASSLFALVARRLHKQWPSLAGTQGKVPEPIAAIRQGLLFGLALVIIGMLALLQMLDVIFALVTFLLVGLLEGFFQNRR